MKSKALAAEIAASLRARNSLVWINTKEEQRVERYLAEAAGAAGYIVKTWDIAQGVCDLSGKADGDSVDLAGPDGVFARIKAESGKRASRDDPNRIIWILRDVPPHLQGYIGIRPLRELRNLAMGLSGVSPWQAQGIVVLSPSGEIPPDLVNHATVIDWPLPDREEIALALDTALKPLREQYPDREFVLDGTAESICDSAVGLSEAEAKACFARSIVQLGNVNAGLVSKQKKQVIEKAKGLTWHDPIPGGLDAVGGLDCLKAWLVSRASAYTPEARSYGLPAPKGAFLVGVQGCGKSLIAKALATAWGVPLLQLDLGALKDKFVGGSESQLRDCFKTIEAVGRCVLWCDEIEKAMSGAVNGAADGGVSADALGFLLTWLQENKSGAFMLATANSDKLPPEFLRAGRFDALWFVDLPNREERAAILNAAMRIEYKRSEIVDCKRVALATEDFIGSEISELVKSALYIGFADGMRPITTDDLLVAAKATVKLSVTKAKEIAALREWARGKAKPASTPDTANTSDGERILDLA